MRYKKVQGVVLRIKRKAMKGKSHNQEQSSFKYGPGGKLLPTKVSLIISIIDSNGKKHLINMTGHQSYGNINVGDEIFIYKGKKSNCFLSCTKIINKSDGEKAFYLR
jgi:hypothetical protein